MWQLDLVFIFSIIYHSGIFYIYRLWLLVTTDRVWREMFFCILQWFCNSLIVTWTSNQIGVLFKFRLRQGNFKQCRSDRNVHMGNFIIIAGIETIPICWVLVNEFRDFWPCLKSSPTRSDILLLQSCCWSLQKQAVFDLK